MHEAAEGWRQQCKLHAPPSLSQRMGLVPVRPNGAGTAFNLCMPAPVGRRAGAPYVARTRGADRRALRTAPRHASDRAICTSAEQTLWRSASPRRSARHRFAAKPSPRQARRRYRELFNTLVSAARVVAARRGGAAEGMLGTLRHSQSGLTSDRIASVPTSRTGVSLIQSPHRWPWPSSSL